MRDPRFIISAAYGRRNFTVQVTDSEGDKCSFIGYFDWRRDSEGIHLEHWDYWPKSGDLQESVEDHIKYLLGEL